MTYGPLIIILAIVVLIAIAVGVWFVIKKLSKNMRWALLILTVFVTLVWFTGLGLTWKIIASLMGIGLLWFCYVMENEEELEEPGIFYESYEDNVSKKNDTPVETNKIPWGDMRP